MVLVVWACHSNHQWDENLCPWAPWVTADPGRNVGQRLEGQMSSLHSAIIPVNMQINWAVLYRFFHPFRLLHQVEGNKAALDWRSLVSDVLTLERRSTGARHILCFVYVYIYTLTYSGNAFAGMAMTRSQSSREWSGRLVAPGWRRWGFHLCHFFGFHAVILQ